MGAHLVFLDESGFLLKGTVSRTWAPRGRTPIVYTLQRHDRVSVVSGLSVSPRRHRLGLYYQVHSKNIQHAEVCGFLRHLLRHLRGPLIVLWDNGQIHKGESIREFRALHRRVRFEYFPGYAPELNPDEGVWDQAKKALANGRVNNADELRRRVSETLAEVGSSPAKLRACIRRSDLPHFRL